MGMNQSLDGWLHDPRPARSGWQQDISRHVPPEFRAEPLAWGMPTRDAYLLPEFTHGPTGTRWVYIPGGTFSMGLSEEEEEAARSIEDPPPLSIEEMRPVRRVEVAPFLVMKAPVSWALADGVIGPRDLSQRPSFGAVRDLSPAYLTRPEVDDLCLKLGFGLPSESQWEYMCRGGTSSLFFFGNVLPSTPEALGELVSVGTEKDRVNPFGLAGVFVGEWCRTRFRRTYDDPEETPDFVVRGGASAFWPWQGSEWAYCVSAMRMPSCDLLGAMCGARLIMDLEPR